MVLLGDGRNFRSMQASFYINLTQAIVILEEIASEKMSH